MFSRRLEHRLVLRATIASAPPRPKLLGTRARAHAVSLLGSQHATCSGEWLVVSGQRRRRSVSAFILSPASLILLLTTDRDGSACARRARAGAERALSAPAPGRCARSSGAMLPGWLCDNAVDLIKISNDHKASTCRTGRGSPAGFSRSVSAGRGEAADRRVARRRGRTGLRHGIQEKENRSMKRGASRDARLSAC
jgi:hypothetical protein